MAKLTISLDEKELSAIVAEGETFALSPKGEAALLKLYALKKRVEEAEEMVKRFLQEKMAAEKIFKVEGEKVKVARRYFGCKYAVTDERKVKETGFGIVKEYVYPNVKAIEAYVETMGSLPEGIERKERGEHVVICVMEEEENEI